MKKRQVLAMVASAVVLAAGAAMSAHAAQKEF